MYILGIWFEKFNIIFHNEKNTYMLGYNFTLEILVPNLKAKKRQPKDCLLRSLFKILTQSK
jgi:hypothetical protein